MAKATIGELREGLRARLDTISGLRAYRRMPAKPEPPAAAVLPRTGEYEESFDGAVTHRFHIWLYVQGADIDRGQAAIDEYLDPAGARSIKQVIEADPTLGGLECSAKVVGYEAYAQLVDVAGTQLLGTTVQVEVLA